MDRRSILLANGRYSAREKTNRLRNECFNMLTRIYGCAIVSDLEKIHSYLYALFSSGYGSYYINQLQKLKDELEVIADELSINEC